MLRSDARDNRDRILEAERQTVEPEAASLEELAAYYGPSYADGLYRST